ncbi:hypothetical protein LY474_26495 [Myxococcus stipitatus]|uniref:hypothetical protein n=1 Tax=Myxococcus stipitatus TaxID=83455 RepID=UPI001F2EC921|nr:hypothetical protein [Myxococcus stipitatus]MCE9671361.1 hypothetical protein [Myxococcus stipitatus]
MKRLQLLPWACAAALVVGCGQTSEGAASEEGEQRSSSEALSACTATCQYGSVSCPSTTVTCSAANGQGVTCDGTFYPCTSCTLYCDTCAEAHRTACDVFGARYPCCAPDGSQGVCDCIFGSWNCRPR